MAGFYYYGQISGGSENPVTVDALIGNSETVTVGDCVKKDAGNVHVCDANDTPIFGVVVAIVSAKGIDLSNAPTADYDGTYTDGGVGIGTYVATSDNETDKKVMARVNCDPMSLWKNTADSALSAAKVFQFFSLVDEDQVDGDTNNETVGEVQLWKWQPDIGDATTAGLFRICASGLSSAEWET